MSTIISFIANVVIFALVPLLTYKFLRKIYPWLNRNFPLSKQEIETIEKLVSKDNLDHNKYGNYASIEVVVALIFVLPLLLYILVAYLPFVHFQDNASMQFIDGFQMLILFLPGMGLAVAISAYLGNFFIQITYKLFNPKENSKALYYTSRVMGAQPEGVKENYNPKTVNRLLLIFFIITYLITFYFVFSNRDILTNTYYKDGGFVFTEQYQLNEIDIKLYPKKNATFILITDKNTGKVLRDKVIGEGFVSRLEKLAKTGSFPVQKKDRNKITLKEIGLASKYLLVILASSLLAGWLAVKVNDYLRKYLPYKKKSIKLTEESLELNRKNLKRYHDAELILFIALWVVLFYKHLDVMLIGLKGPDVLARFNEVAGFIVSIFPAILVALTLSAYFANYIIRGAYKLINPKKDGRILFYTSQITASKKAGFGSGKTPEERLRTLAIFLVVLYPVATYLSNSSIDVLTRNEYQDRSPFSKTKFYNLKDIKISLTPVQEYLYITLGEEVILDTFVQEDDIARVRKFINMRK